MKEKSVSEAIKFRRSVRIYNPKKSINSNLVKKCIEQALLSPSSSNLQLWEFYHIKSENFLKSVVRVCFNQPAAKTAQELVIPVVRLDLWPERINSNVNFIKSSNKGKDKEKIFDRYLQQKKLLGKRGEIIDKKIGKKIKLLWEKS